MMYHPKSILIFFLQNFCIRKIEETVGRDRVDFDQYLVKGSLEDVRVDKYVRDSGLTGITKTLH